MMTNKYYYTTSLLFAIINMILLQLSSVQSSMVTATTSYDDQAYTIFDNNESTNEQQSKESNNNNKVISTIIHPTSSYIRYLQLQLDDINSQLSTFTAGAATLYNDEGAANDDDGINRRLRHSSDEQLDARTEEYNDYEQQQLTNERDIIQHELNSAISKLVDSNSGAAYATLMEFEPSLHDYALHDDESLHDKSHPTEAQPEVHDSSSATNKRHRVLKQRIQRKLSQHNSIIQEYNSNYRMYSKYEWSIRDNSRESATAATYDSGYESSANENNYKGSRKMLLGSSKDNISIVDTTWQAIEITFNKTIGLVPIIEDCPITLQITTQEENSTNKTIISGKSGCNNYHGHVTLSISTTSSSSTTNSSSSEVNKYFNTSTQMAGTKMYCHSQSIMEQEDNYLHFISGSKYYYEFVNAVIDESADDNGKSTDGERSDNSEVGDVELVLFTNPTRSKEGKLVSNEVVARFKPHKEEVVIESIEGGSSEEEEGRRISSTAVTDETATETAILDNEDTNINNNNQSRRKTQQTKKKGGLFNAYQTSPLHQGYGTHYATIWVGTPSQRKSVIIDTGSHFTAFPCKGCENCGEEHHTDKYFDYEASTTFRKLTCGQCNAAQCEDNSCIFSQTYTEGSSWSAFESIDKVFVGGKELSSALNPINNSFKTDFLFGCQVKESGLFVTQLADGIMGMSAHPSTLPRAMYEQGKLEHNMFSMCFRRELHVSKQGIVAGMLTLGGIDTTVDLSPMVYARNVASTGWFTVFVKNVYIRELGGQRAKADGPHQQVQKINADIYAMNSGKGVIIDSGTTDTYLHESIAKSFEKVWQRVTGKPYSNDPVKIDKKDLLLLPTVLIQMQAYDEYANPLLKMDEIDKMVGLAGDIDSDSPQDIILAVPATHYMEYSASKETYTPRIYFTESKGGVIGANAMQGHNVLFDWENKRIGFAESTCEYQEESKTITEEGVMSVDCRLGAPSLSVSCSDSADLSQCERGANPDTALNGLEIWTRIVQAPGTPQGQTCEEVSIEQNRVNGGGQMEVNCDGKGVCREVRNCVISCANAIAHGASAASKASLSAIGSCGAVAWSACTSSCTQTKIDSTLMNDGKCHEEKSLEATRACHVQACGRSDPCRVPFVVHAILKIRGAVAVHWTKHAEEIFTEAYTYTMNDKRKKRDAPLFEPGDVIVLNASPWRASDDTIFGTGSLEGEDEELGMQLVVETSIFNHDAVLPPSRNGQVPLATCHERELQPLANIALDIHRKLAQPNFIDLVVERMKNDVALGEKTVSPFYYTFELNRRANKGQVVTSWTIKTDIGAGSRMIDFNSDLPMGLLLLFLVSSIVIYACWSLRLCSARRRSGEDDSSVGHYRDRRRSKYSRVNKNRLGGDEDNATTMGVIDEEQSYADDVSVMTNNTEYTMSSMASTSGSTTHSLGSLSTYLAKTSSRK